MTALNKILRSQITSQGTSDDRFFYLRPNKREQENLSCSRLFSDVLFRYSGLSGGVWVFHLLLLQCRFQLVRYLLQKVFHVYLLLRTQLVHQVLR